MIASPEQQLSDLLEDLENDLRWSLANDPDEPQWTRYRRKLSRQIEALKDGTLTVQGFIDGEEP